MTKFSTYALVVLLAATTPTAAFLPPQPKLTSTTTTTTALGMSSRAREATAQMRQMREQMAADDEAALFMQALRGQNLNDDDAASLSTVVRLVEIDGASGDDQLPFDYNPKALKEFFRKRPAAVLTRIAQVTSVGGGYALKVLVDQLTGKLNDPEREIQRAGELRDLLTSLGPFFIK